MLKSFYNKCNPLNKNKDICNEYLRKIVQIQKTSINISAIIFTYKRPIYFQEQLNAIRNQAISPTEIIVGHLANEKTKNFDFSKVDKIIKFEYDPGIYAKFITATAAKGNFIAIFDDDVIPGTQWLENCLNCFRKKEGLYGSFGGRLTRNSYKGVQKFGGLRHKNDSIEEVDFIGQSWFFPFEYLHYFWKEKPPFYNNAEDIFFSYILQKYANIKSFITPYPKKDKDLWGSIHPEYGIDKNALFLRDRWEHNVLRNEIVRLLIERGWNLIKNKIDNRQRSGTEKAQNKHGRA